MTNAEVLEKFLKGGMARTPQRRIKLDNGNIWEVSTLSTALFDNRIELVNYSTVIAKLYFNDVLELNATKYSKTTSIIQNKLKRLAENTNYEIITYVVE